MSPGVDARGAGEQVPRSSAGILRTETRPEVGAVAVGDLAHPAADLEEPKTERVDWQLGGFGLGSGQPAAERVQQPVGGQPGHADLHWPVEASDARIYLQRGVKGDQPQV